MTVVPKGFLTQESLAQIAAKAKEVQDRLRHLRSQRTTSVETWSTTQPLPRSHQMPLPSGTNSDFLHVYPELANGGSWLSTARTWLQSNVRGGDSLSWSSGESVSVPFFKFEDFALRVAVAAVSADRLQRRRDLELLAKKHGVGSVAWLQLQLLDKDPSLPVHFRDPTLVLVSHQVQSVKYQMHVVKESEFPTVLLETEPLPKQVGPAHETTTYL